MIKEKYTNGLEMEKFENLPQISVYNSNYYVGFDKDLILGESDDDNETIWYILDSGHFQILGYSYESDNNKLVIPK